MRLLTVLELVHAVDPRSATTVLQHITDDAAFALYECARRDLERLNTYPVPSQGQTERMNYLAFIEETLEPRIVASVAE